MMQSPTHYRRGLGKMLEAMRTAGASATEAINMAYHFCPERQRFRGYSDYLKRCVASIKSDWEFGWRAPPIRQRLPSQ